MNVFKIFMVAIIVFNMSFGTSFTQVAFAADNKEKMPNPELPYSKVLQELDSAKVGQLPKNTTDAFHLLGQSLEITSGKFAGHYALDRMDIKLPNLTVSDYDMEVQPFINEKTKNLEFNFINKQGRVLAKHSFLNLKIVAFAVDKELLVLLDESGKMMAMDIGYVRGYIFQSPIPVIELLKTSMLSSETADLSMGFISRKLEPVDIFANLDGEAIVPLDSLLTAGDVAVWDSVSTSDSKRKLVACLNRDVIKTQLYTAEALISMMAFQLDPSPEKEGVMEGVKLLGNDRPLQSQYDLGVEYSKILGALPARTVNRLLSRAYANKSNIGVPRDQFSLSEWQTQFAENIKKNKNENSRYAETTKPKWRESLKTPADLFHKVMTSKSMKIMAGLIVASTAVYAVDSFQFASQGAIWANHLVNEVYNLYIPDVVKDSAYRVTLLKSSLALSAFVPLVYAIGHLYAKVKGVSWSAQKSLATMSMRVYAALMLPFWNYLAQIAHQPNFIRSLQLGINPLARITKDSPIGQKFGISETLMPAFNNPFLSSDKGAKKLLLNTQLQSGLYQQKARTRSLAWALALQTVSEQFGLDPVSIAALVESNGTQLNDQQIEKLTESKEFQSVWIENANELFVKFTKIKNNELVEDFKNIDPQELNRFYNLAKELAQNLKQRSSLDKVIGRLVIKWRHFSENAIVGLANFGINEHQFLKNAEPSDFVISQFWKQFVADYLLSVGQVAVIGDRANLHDSQALAANEQSFLWTSPGHRFDMIDQVRIYMINVPARLALVYQNLKEVSEDNYQPIENKSMLGAGKTESFWAGISEWTKGTTNLVQAGYGFIWMRSLHRSIKSLQANLIMAAIGRVMFGGQSVLPALSAFTYGFAWAQWQYGWLWEPINRGNQIYQDRVEAQKNKFLEVKSKLAKALRTDNLNEIASASAELADFYDKGLGKHDEFERITGEGLRILRDLEPTQISEMHQSMRLDKQSLSQLQQALNSGDVNLIEKSRIQIVGRYLKSETLTDNDRLQINKMDAVGLLQFALATPPFVTEPNTKVEWLTTMAGAIITTYWGTTMSVLTFRPDISWPEKIAEAGVLSALLYGGTFYGQKALNWSAKKLEVWQKDRKLGARTMILKCENLF